MKKVLFGLFALSTMALASEGHFYLRAGVDFAEKFDEIKEENIKINDSESEDRGYEIAVEYLKEVFPNLELGFGVAYQYHGAPEGRTVSYVDRDDYTQEIYYGKDEFKMPEFNSIPLYATAKYNIPVEWNVKPYVKFDFGYSFNDGDNLKQKWDEDIYDSTTGAHKGKYSSYDESSTKIKDGIYYGIGAGLQYHDFTVDLMYKVNTADIEVGEVTEDYDYYTVEKSIDYSRFVLSFGYRF